MDSNKSIIHLQIELEIPLFEIKNITNLSPNITFFAYT